MIWVVLTQVRWSSSWKTAKALLRNKRVLHKLGELAQSEEDSSVAAAFGTLAPCPRLPYVSFLCAQGMWSSVNCVCRWLVVLRPLADDILLFTGKHLLDDSEWLVLQDIVAVQGVTKELTDRLQAQQEVGYYNESA